MSSFFCTLYKKHQGSTVTVDFLTHSTDKRTNFTLDWISLRVLLFPQFVCLYPITKGTLYVNFEGANSPKQRTF